MPIEDFRGNVTPIADDFLWNILAELVRDRPAPDRVRRETARTVVVVPVLRGFAVLRLAIVGTALDHAGLRKSVHLRTDLPGTQPPSIACHERLASVLVHDVVTVKPDVLVEDVAVVVVERNRPLGWLLVLERRPGIRAVAKPEALFVGLVVLEVDRSKTPEADPRMPEDRHDDVLAARALVPLEVADNLLSAVGIKHLVARFVTAVDVRQLHPLAHPRLDGVDRRAELEEDAQCCELPAKRDDVHVLLSPHAVSVEIATSEVVEVVDSDRVTPLDEGVEPVLVVLERLRAHLEFAVRDIEVDRLARCDRLEVVAHALTLRVAKLLSLRKTPPRRSSLPSSV